MRCRPTDEVDADPSSERKRVPTGAQLDVGSRWGDGSSTRWTRCLHQILAVAERAGRSAISRAHEPRADQSHGWIGGALANAVSQLGGRERSSTVGRFPCAE